MLSPSARRQQQVDLGTLRGVPAFLFILKNSGLKEGMLHIGLSRRGGWAKALELNRDKNNVIPGSFECVYELRAQDSGTALELVFEILKHARQGRGRQDYFEIDEQSARHIIERCVEESDKRFQLKFQRDLAYRSCFDNSQNSQGTYQEQKQHKPKTEIRESIFKKALTWLS